MAPVFIALYLTDKPVGETGVQYNIGIGKGIITDQVTGVPIDMHGGYTWHGDLPLPAEYPSYLNITTSNETGTDRALNINYSWEMTPGGSGFSAQEPRLTWPAGATWVYHTVGIQSNAGGGNGIVNFAIDEGNEVIFQRIIIGPDNYGAARSITVTVRDETPANVAIWGSLSMDNQTLSIPASALAAANAIQDTTGDLSRLVTGAMTLRVTAVALAQNETLTIGIAARIRGAIPTVTTTGSTGTWEIVTGYSKVT
jgi:hypothetical protein